MSEFPPIQPYSYPLPNDPDPSDWFQLLMAHYCGLNCVTERCLSPNLQDLECTLS